MESLYKELGKKYHRDMSGLEVSKLIGTSRTILYKFLREQNIFCKTNGRNLPTDLYLRKKWFNVKEQNISNPGFEGIVSTTYFTPLGYKEIRDMIYSEHSHIIHTYTQESFWTVLTNKIRSKLSKLGLNFITDKDMESHIKSHIVTYTDNETKDSTIRYSFGSDMIDLIKFNKDNLKIYG